MKTQSDTELSGNTLLGIFCMVQNHLSRNIVYAHKKRFNIVKDVFTVLDSRFKIQDVFIVI